MSCTASESASQTAISGTEEAVQAVTQEALNLKKTQEAILAAAETEKTLSVSQTQTALPHNCTPGGTYVDIAGDVDIDYMDILKVDTVMEKDLLTVTFYVRGLPKEITVNREELEEGSEETQLGVSIDVDNNIETGGSLGESRGFEYSLRLWSFKFGAQQTGPIEKLISADLYEVTNTSMRTVGKAELSVDYAKNTITLSSKVPGINTNSILYFSTTYFKTNNTLSADDLCN